MKSAWSDYSNVEVADAIIDTLRSEIAAGNVPADLTSFWALLDVCVLDPNDFFAESGATVTEETQENWTAWCKEVEALVDERIKEGALR